MNLNFLERSFAMKIMRVVLDFFTFKGNLSAKQLFCCIFLIELLRVLIIQLFASLALPAGNLTVVLTYLPLMVTVLYLYGAAIAARLRNLGINPSLTYFWVWGIWFIRYILMPSVQTTQDMFYIVSVGFAFILWLLPLFAENKEVLQLRR